MPSAEKLQRRADNKRAHALARIETRNGVDPADVDITERIFTSEEEENLPELMCDGHVAGRERGAREQPDGVLLRASHDGYGSNMPAKQASASCGRWR